MNLMALPIPAKWTVKPGVVGNPDLQPGDYLEIVTNSTGIKIYKTPAGTMTRSLWGDSCEVKIHTVHNDQNFTITIVPQNANNVPWTHRGDLVDSPLNAVTWMADEGP